MKTVPFQRWTVFLLFSDLFLKLRKYLFVTPAFQLTEDKAKYAVNPLSGIGAHIPGSFLSEDPADLGRFFFVYLIAERHIPIDLLQKFPPMFRGFLWLLIA